MSKIFSHKIFFTSLVSIVIFGALLWVFLRLNGEMGLLGAKLNEIQTQVLFAEQERKALRLAEATIKEHEEDLNRVDHMFVEKDQPIELVESLEAVAKSTGNLFVVDLDENKSKEGPDLVFRVAVDGSQVSVLRYLKSLEFLPYKIAIKEFNFQKIDGDKATHRLSLLVSAETL